MTNAFVMVNCEPNTIDHVKRKLNEITGVRESERVFGAYDCIVKTNDMSSSDIQDLIRTKIRTIKGIRSTLTLNKIK